MATRKETRERQDYRTLLRVSVLIVVFLSLGLFALGLEVSRSDGSAGTGAGISVAATPVAHAEGAAGVAHGEPFVISGTDDPPQRKPLAVMLTALAAALLWLWRELPLGGRSRHQ